MTRCVRKTSNLTWGLSTLLLWAITCGFIQNPAWNKISSGIYESRVTALCIHPRNHQIIFAGTRKAVYKSEDGGQTYRSVSSSIYDLKNISRILIDPDHPDLILAATANGLFQSRDLGQTWQRIYNASDALSRSCTDVLIFENRIYLATLKGLYSKLVEGSNWTRELGNFYDKEVYRLTHNGAFLFMGTEAEVYRYDPVNRDFSKIFASHGSQSGDVEIDTDEITDWDVLSRVQKIRDVYIRSGIYLAADDGIYVSHDQGDSWNKLAVSTIPGEIRAMIVLSGPRDSHGTGDAGSQTGPHPDILIGTDKGVFRYEGGRWVPLYQGLESSRINQLAVIEQEGLYAATDAGVFFRPVKKALSPENLPMLDYREILNNFSNEPSIRDVQKIAIDYAEVHPSKIRDWRAAAQKRAWLPSLSIGVDGDKNLTLGDSVWGSYSSGGQLFIGPDDKTFYNNFSWDVSLSWDLADLIWSSDQTSIDSRSKLMVELREDILDQVTRLYFERRRLQVELAALQNPDAQTILDKNMRIDELTALIDGLTGGEFSRRIKSGQEAAGDHPRRLHYQKISEGRHTRAETEVTDD